MDEHDKAPADVLKRLKEKGLTLNYAKCAFDMEEIDYFGPKFGKHRLKPNPNKTNVLNDAAHPESKEELQTLLDIAGYNERFVP